MHKLRFIEKEKPRLLTVNEAAYKLGVSPKTIRNWQHQGKLPYIKLFGAVRFDTVILNQLIQKSSINRGVPHTWAE